MEYDFRFDENIGVKSIGSRITDSSGNGNPPPKTIVNAGKNRLQHHCFRLPQGYRQQLGRRFDETDLSGGECESCACPRLHARRAGVILMNRPRPDARAEYEVFRRLQNSSPAAWRSSSRIASPQSMADRILVLNEGTVVEGSTRTSCS